MTERLHPVAERFALAERALLTPNDLDTLVLARTLGDMSGKGTDFADLYLELSTHDDWQLERGKVTRGSFHLSHGVGARAISGEKAAFAYASDLKPRTLLALAASVRDMQRQGQDAASTGGAPVLRQSAETPSFYPSIEAAASIDSVKKIALLRDIDERARSADFRITHVTATLSVSDTTILFAATDGTLAADIRPLVHLQLMVIAETAARRSNGAASVGGRFALGAIDGEAIDALVRRAVRTAIVKLDARPAPAGVMPVVLGPGFPGVLLHEAVGHGLEGDAHRKRSSVFANLMGQQIAAKSVTVVDDGSVTGARGSLNVDDEGNAGRRNVLIEDGKLVGLMQDRLNSRLMNASATGNGRRQSYAHLPMPRMTNTFLENGDADPAEIIASIKTGIYAVEFGGGTVDITSGQFNFSATEAWLVEDGKITAPLDGATLVGKGHEALKHISMIGNDLRLDPGICGKNAQLVPVTVGQPTIRIDEIVVGGAG